MVHVHVYSYCLKCNLVCIDQAIIGFRETEKSRWTSAGSSAVIERLISKATSSVKGKKLEPLPLIHVLDLAPDGLVG